MINRKQLSWRGSNLAVSLLLLSISYTCISPMEGDSLSSKNSNSRFFGSTHKAMKEVYEDAPQRAKRIVAHLKDPEAIGCPSWRYAFFYGEPGCGKSTLLKAIAVESGWYLDFIPCGELQSHGKNQRNQTGINLYNRLNEVVRYNVPTIVGLDEINELGEGFDNEHKDTGFTIKVLWDFLDQQAGNTKFFLIGTMNRAHKLPKPMKSRAKGCSIEIEAPKEILKKLRMIENIFTNERTTFHEECNRKFLLDFLEKTQNFNGRDYESLAMEALGQSFDEFGKQTKIWLRKRHIINALDIIRKTEKDFKYHKVEETEEERQERQFIQQQILQLRTQERQKGTTTLGIPGLISRTTNSGMNRSDIKDVIGENFTAEQLDHYKEFMGRSTVMEKNIREDFGLTNEC